MNWSNKAKQVKEASLKEIEKILISFVAFHTAGRIFISPINILIKTKK